MTSKLNIFNALPAAASDSEDEITAKNAKTRSTHEKRDQRKQEGQKGPHGHTAPRDPTQKEDVTRAKNTQKKVLTAEPHPNDRQSGTGTQAFGVKPKKAGAGKGNWGNYKEDRKPTGEEGEEVESTEVQEEEKPEGITLAEYLANRGATSSQPLVNEAKSKITSEQLMKEVGKATLLKQQEIDDKIIGQKKGKLNVNHHASINTEHSELLGFRTGFVEREYKERSRDDAPQFPRKFGGERRAPREERQKEEGQTETQTETTPVEGTTTEGTATTTEAKPQEERRQYQKGGRGGYNKDRPQGDRPHGDRPHGDRPHGDRPQGERRPYAGKQGNTAKVNVEDESAFPKLG
jgi:hypothetical protein